VHISIYLSKTQFNIILHTETGFQNRLFPWYFPTNILYNNLKLSVKDSIHFWKYVFTLENISFNMPASTYLCTLKLKSSTFASTKVQSVTFVLAAREKNSHTLPCETDSLDRRHCFYCKHYSNIFLIWNVTCSLALRILASFMTDVRSSLLFAICLYLFTFSSSKSFSILSSYINLGLSTFILSSGLLKKMWAILITCPNHSNRPLKPLPYTELYSYIVSSVRG
jgi:hypothetical protein